MVDLSGYKDLTKPPARSSLALEDDDDSQILKEREMEHTMTSTTQDTGLSALTRPASYATHPEVHDNDVDAYAEYSGNVRTLLKLVGDLPAEVSKQSGAQVIRLTMEAMGISMENVLSEAQTAQSQLLDSVRSNIKKIEEYKTVIRRLESENKTLQSKTNELSEIIDLFILSNTSTHLASLDRTEVGTY